jgi:hypothetical protein
MHLLSFYAKHWPDCAATPIACSCGLSQLLATSERLLKANKDADIFDYMGRKVAIAFVETLQAMDGFQEPFRAGGITALEELWLRLTHHDLDWEELKEGLAKYQKIGEG